MIDTKTETRLAADGLRGETLRDLLRTEGPCITVILPPYRPGEPGKPAAAILKTGLQEAASKLAARKIAKPLIEELLEPLHQLAHEEESLAGSGLARAILRCRSVFRQVDLPVPPTPATACAVGDCFWIRPLLKSLAVPEKIYVLDLTRKSVALLACGLQSATPVELPKGTPRTLDEAMNFDAPDHDLMNRSSAGPSTGAMRGVQFGTGRGREAQRAHLHDFYNAVDRGVNEVLRSQQSPLVLAGVEEDVAAYRSVNLYPHLVEKSIPAGAGEPLVSSHISRQARDAVLFDLERRAELRAGELRERFAPARFSTDLDAILRAAAEGRVSDLYLDENGQRTGNFQGKVFGGHANWQDEDLLNVAAVETLLSGGAVYPLPSHAMPRGAVAAAMFRY
jgi:Bacterial archaeo-eukaryotic release factor family 3